MKRFVESWEDDLRLTPCCQTADEETIATETDEVFNCETCPVQAALDGLDGDNMRAWRLMRSLCTRFNVDTQALPMVLMRLTAEDDAEEFADLMTRLAIIYDVQCPPKKAEG